MNNKLCREYSSSTLYFLRQTDKDQLLAVQKDIDENLEIKARGAMVRSRADWVALGEKPTSYFLSLEKHYANRKAITRLMLPNGNCVTNEVRILKEQQKFYQELFTSSQIEFNPNYLSSIRQKQS